MMTHNLKVPSTFNDDAVCIGFVECFKEIQRQAISVAQRFGDKPIMPEAKLVALRGLYLDIASRFEERRAAQGVAGELIDNLDFELVLFSSAPVYFDSVIGMISDYSYGRGKMNCDQLVALIRGDSGLMEHRDDLAAYVRSILGAGMDADQVKRAFEAFKANLDRTALDSLAREHRLDIGEVLAFFDLGWKARVAKERKFMADLIPLLKARQPNGISGIRFFD